MGHLGGNVVLTPNPTEIAYCLHVDEDEIEDDPAGAAVELSRRAKAVIGLGGARSWIATPDDRLWQDDSGGAGLGVSARGTSAPGSPRTARPRGRSRPGRRLGRVSARPDGGAAGVLRGPARLPGPRAAAEVPRALAEITS